MHNARCCKQWGEYLKNLGLEKASSKLLRSAMKWFVHRYKSLPESVIGCKISALFEAIKISLEIGKLTLCRFI